MVRGSLTRRDNELVQFGKDEVFRTVFDIEEFAIKEVKGDTR